MDILEVILAIISILLTISGIIWFSGKHREKRYIKQLELSKNIGHLAHEYVDLSNQLLERIKQFRTTTDDDEELNILSEIETTLTLKNEGANFYLSSLMVPPDKVDADVRKALFDIRRQLNVDVNELQIVMKEGTSFKDLINLWVDR